LQRAGWVSDPPPCDAGPYLTQILAAAGDRIKVAGDALDYADFYVADDRLVYDEKTLDKRLRKAEGATELLTEFRGQLATVEPFAAEELERLLKVFVEAKSVKLGDLVHALRVAVTGKAVGFGLFETLAILGRERCLARIDRALSL
jgi:glutamyl-tRNA synthetase